MDGFREFLLNEAASDFETVNYYLNQPNLRIKELSQLTGKSIGELYRTLKNYNVTPNRLKSNHHHVVNFHKFGFNIKQIADLTGYTPRNIRYILSRIKND